MTVETASEIFDSRQAETLLEADSNHWWFRAKARLVAELLSKYAPPGLLVDLGGGAGGVTAALGRADTVLVEGNQALAEQARRLHGLQAVTAGVGASGLRRACAGAVTLLDVIEHLEDPQLALSEARRLLMPGGVLVVSVPAHQWLWSEADVFLGHVKRYTRPTLRGELAEAGLSVRWLSHCFSWLVPPVVARRRLQRSGGVEQQLGLDDTSPAVDRLATRLCAAERRLLRATALPLGTSIMAVAAV